MRPMAKVPERNEGNNVDIAKAGGHDYALCQHKHDATLAAQNHATDTARGGAKLARGGQHPERCGALRHDVIQRAL